MKASRQLLSTLALASVVSVSTMRGDFHDHIGLQLWSLRTQFKADPAMALDMVKKYGFTEVETAGVPEGMTAEKFRDEMKARGLNPVSAHVQYQAMEKDVAAVVRDVQGIGARYAICPWIPHEGEFNAAAVQKAAADFNKWGEAFRAAGIRFGYHPHGFEFVASSKPGETLLDDLINATKPANVCYEMDVFWVVHGGGDPVKLLQKYHGRWVALHVKDIRKGAPTGLTSGHAPDTDNVAVGSGAIDWPAVIRAAQSANVTFYFIEDETPVPTDAIPASLKYLHGLKL